MRSIVWMSILMHLLCISKMNAQKQIAFSVSSIFSKVQVQNNYGPARKINGNSIGVGLGIQYYFKPKLFTLPKGFRVTFGLGYQKQSFFIKRPFKLDSPLLLLYYTKMYSYHNIQTISGIDFESRLMGEFSIFGELNYYWLTTFRQKYQPTYSLGDFDKKQV
ncbi:MAG: hypothetical protein ACK48F_02085, partial [Chryseotalea sp.]